MTGLISQGIYWERERKRYRAELYDKIMDKRIRKRFKTKALAKRWIRSMLGRVPSGNKIDWRFAFADAV